jgi:ligand-binding sensor domain-containing protein
MPNLAPPPHRFCACARVAIAVNSKRALSSAGGAMITRSRLFSLFVALGALASRAETTGGDDHGTELHDFAVRTWTRADGLPDSSVTVILQSRDGYLWIGTGAGLARFDGVKFTGIPLPAKGRANEIVSITALCEDQSGGLWIGSQEHGLFYRRNGRIRRFTAADGLLDSAVTSLTLDNAQRVWIGTRHGVNRWDGRRLEAFTTRS